MEHVTNILSSKDNSNVDSEHDIIISEVSLEHVAENNEIMPRSSAPVVKNIKHKILWTEDGIPDYESLLTPVLTSIQQNWSNPKSPI